MPNPVFPSSWPPASSGDADWFLDGGLCCCAKLWKKEAAGFACECWFKVCPPFARPGDAGGCRETGLCWPCEMSAWGFLPGVGDEGGGGLDGGLWGGEVLSWWPPWGVLLSDWLPAWRLPLGRGPAGGRGGLDCAEDEAATPSCCCARGVLGAVGTGWHREQRSMEIRGHLKWMYNEATLP